MNTTSVGPMLWSEPFAPRTTVESILPDEDGHIGYRVVPALEAEVSYKLLVLCHFMCLVSTLHVMLC